MKLDDILKYAVEHGMIDMSSVLEEIKVKQRQELLGKYPYSIWQGADGKWYTRVMEDGKRKLKKRRTKEEIEDVAIKSVEKSEDSPTWRDIFYEWNNRRTELNKISPATKLRYEKIFNRHFTEFGKRKVKDTQPIDITDFLEAQIPKYQMTAKGFCNLKTTMKGMIKRARKQGYCNFTADILNDVETSEVEFKKNYKEDYEEVFNDEEMVAIMKHLEANLDDKNMAIMLIFITGMRVGEVVALKHEDLGENYIKVRRTETMYKVDGKAVYDVKESPKTEAGIRTVVIPSEYEWLLKKIKRISPFTEWVFAKDGRRMREKMIQARLYRLCDKLGIYRKSPHKIRKTYVSILLDNHVDQRTVIDQVGHSNIAISEKYYHRNRKSIEDKQNIFNQISELGGKGVI